MRDQAASHHLTLLHLLHQLHPRCLQMHYVISTLCSCPTFMKEQTRTHIILRT